MTTDLPEGGPRRLPRTLGGMVYVAVVAMTLVGLVIAVLGPWRTGLVWIGAGLLLGAVARALLSEYGAGMLRVRRRWSDVITLAAVGVALLVLAVIVPEQPL